MKIQKCNACKTEFHDKPWIDECPVCRSKNINHNEDNSLFEWYNYGDVNFMEYGGCLVREAEFKDCFEVIWLNPEVWDYKGKYKKPMIIARCYIDLGLWLRTNDEEMKLFNKYSGYGEDYVPYTMEEKMYYGADLVSYYGIQEFDPEFPEETGCGPYGFTWNKIIVGKTIAQRFLKEHSVPVKFRK